MGKRIVGLLMLGVTVTGARGELAGNTNTSFYRDLPLFSTRADETKAVQSIDRLGPVGIGIELHQPAFVMKVKHVEQGSPAEATGQFKAGQIIETINGQKLQDIDPRIQLGGMITQAEATDGKVRFMVRDTPETAAQEVVVQIPVLGAYSKTWPLNCPKSDKIVRNMADYLARTGNHADLGYDLGLLFMLSTGEEKDLEVARGWVSEVVAKTKDSPQINTAPWFAGWSGIGFCEYYLRTGDDSVLPLIEKLADYLKRTMYNNGWSCRGAVEFNYYSGGLMNAAGVHCLTTLLLAKECGVKVDEYTLQASLRQFYRFAGHGNTPYGNHLPESGFVDNGKVGGLAFAMAAAASLTPEGENSTYAKARDITAAKGFYSTSWMLHGHTGGGIGEIWRSAAMGLMVEKTPRKYREFMDNRMWHYELSRRYDGSFGILGGERYDADGAWGNAYPLAYTIPRKTLRISGAKPTTFSKSYKLPERPWGTAADDVFLSLSPASDKDGKAQDVDAEMLATDAGAPIMWKIGNTNVSDAVLLMYCRHPEQGVREMAYGTIRGQNRDRLIVELLKDKDPRARHSGAMVASMFAAGKNRTAEPERLTDEMVQLLIGMINDPAESWWTVRSALTALSVAPPESLVPQVDRLCHWLQHDEWWLQSAAVSAVAGIAGDERCYQKVLPVIGQMVASNQVMSLGTRWSVMGQLASKLKEASPEVQALVVQVLGEAYAKTPVKMTAPGGMNMDPGAEILTEEQAQILAGIPGGLDELYKRAHERYPGKALPHKNIFMTADPAKLSGDLKAAVTQLIRERVIPEFVGAANHIASNRKLLLDEATSAVPFVGNYYYRGPRMDELVGMYNSIGVHDYNWHDFGANPNTMRWDYLSFDPPETKLPGTGWRYRKVTCPAGMANWFAVDFDAKQAGWKSGLQPFGQVNGNLDTTAGKCPLPVDFCRCGYPMQTLWEKEVLLMRGTFTFPKFKEGYRYRLLVGGMSHVSAGEGFRIYVNGKQIAAKDRGVDKREGATPICNDIDKAWWPEFEKPVTIAATSFLQMENGGKQKNRFLVWIQEMKAPPVEQLIRDSAKVVPMTSSDWQARQNNPDNPDINSADGKFLYDGRVIANNAVLGSWTVVAQVASNETFEATSANVDPTSVPFTTVTFKDGGETDNPLRIWSGHILMNLDRNEALTMTLKVMDNGEYLFVDAGGFNEKNPHGWTSPLLVMKRK
ncbi:MAG TPA: hypothetical protein DCS43_11220 [Verrucomicrobia bacterium]|nr:hypothetical protein [Verrucomicrobiota bacterium]